MITGDDDLLRLSGADVQVAVRALGVTTDHRQEGADYEGLSNLDVIDAPDGRASIYLRGDDVVLIFVGPDALPADLDDASLTNALGSEGELLGSRQGKRATLHVVADRGVAWSEIDGQIGFVELFPPTTLRTYLQEIYLEPPAFIR